MHRLITRSLRPNNRDIYGLTYGTDSVPTGAANALLVANASYSLSYSNVSRDVLRGYIGGSEQLAGTRSVELSFDVELSGSGDAGLTAPAWGPLLRGCGYAETDSGAFFEYVPLSTAFPSLSIYYYDDGAIHKALGCRGTCEIKMGVGEKPVMSYKFTGIDGGITAGVNPSLTLSAWKAPVVITDPNAGDILLGATYATGALTGGTAYPSRGLSLSLGNDVKYTPLLGGESIDIVNREVTGSIELDLTAAQETTFMTDINANTLQSIGFSFGSVAGNKIIMHMPSVQRTSPKKAEYNGRRMIGMDLRMIPVSGNDELRIVVL
ncbi:phage tail tube protein [Propionivibrio sp.]|uniref:phage tail tube protein n=1 Tax=Propionivibrio sp. TaxID=2212460 RepID=UPI003BF28BE3